MWAFFEQHGVDSIGSAGGWQAVLALSRCFFHRVDGLVIAFFWTILGIAEGETLHLLDERWGFYAKKGFAGWRPFCTIRETPF